MPLSERPNLQLSPVPSQGAPCDSEWAGTPVQGHLLQIKGLKHRFQDISDGSSDHRGESREGRAEEAPRDLPGGHGGPGGDPKDQGRWNTLKWFPSSRWLTECTCRKSVCDLNPEEEG